MKKTIIAIMAIACMVSFTVTASDAGSSKRRRHHLEGFLIGSGAGFLGATIINKLHHNRPRFSNDEGRCSKKHRHSYKRRHRGPKGYWEVKQIWVEPEYEERWNPGHYNRKGEWRCGRYQRFIVKEGYWKEERIWVCRY